METSPVTCRTLEEYYHINGHTFEKQYKETLSGFRDWEQLSHADEWILFPENIGPHLAIDESSLSNGELYTFVTNRDQHGRDRSLVAVTAGTRSEDVIQKLACDAVQEIRVAHRWDALQQSNEEMEECKQAGKTYTPYRFPNGDTRPELLIRSRYLLFKSANKWTEIQKERANILFDEYPDIQIAYGLSHSLRMIFSKNTMKDAASLSMAQWYNKVDESKIKAFNVIAATFYERYDDILNFYNNRTSNAAAESFNPKIKLFRANLHGVADRKFFLFRIAKIYGYPH
ncbi:MAG: transposase [Bacteroidales bacterium]|nr:transposase [Bacteroidales bacterium]